MKKINYEEDYLKRLPQTKSERQKFSRTLNNNNNINSISDIQDANVFYADDDREDGFRMDGGDNKKSKKNGNKKKLTMKEKKNV